jgi:hypothetical protein
MFPDLSIAILEARDFFTGVQAILIVNFGMTRNLLIALSLVFCCGSALLAKELTAPELSRGAKLILAPRTLRSDSQGGRLLEQQAFFAGWKRFYSEPRQLVLTEKAAFSFPSAFGWTEATTRGDFLPDFVAEQPARTTNGAAFMQEPAYQTLPVFRRFNHASGEVGFFYGKSVDKFDHEVTAGYILGEIDNGTSQISVGASYLRATDRGPH